jgi:hypothetical protein
VSSVSGVCPSLTFKIRGWDVTTDKNTQFTGGSCTNVRKGIDVTVAGELIQEKSVRAGNVVFR